MPNADNPRSKTSVLSKIFGNCVPNFREWVANSKNYKLKNHTKRNDTHEHTHENIYETHTNSSSDRVAWHGGRRVAQPSRRDDHSYRSRRRLWCPHKPAPGVGRCKRRRHDH